MVGIRTIYKCKNQENMRRIISIAILLAFVICEVSSQGIKVYKRNGTVAKYKYAEIDYVEAYPYEEGQQEPQAHVAVDLGLSVKWATCNVGASSPEDYGNYYAWGEVEEKSVYDWDNYKYSDGQRFLYTKYCTSSKFGMIDNKVSIELDDDVAHVKWGGEWRVPTYEEVEELKLNCSAKWTTQNGVYGVVLTGPNGNSIFLPASGNKVGDEYFSFGDTYREMSIWTDRLNRSDNSLAITLDATTAQPLEDIDAKLHWVHVSRDWGVTVRPVCPK